MADESIEYVRNLLDDMIAEIPDECPIPVEDQILVESPILDEVQIPEQVLEEDEESPQNDTRRSSRRTKGISHHDFFPSNMLNFRHIDSHIRHISVEQKKLKEFKAQIKESAKLQPQSPPPELFPEELPEPEMDPDVEFVKPDAGTVKFRRGKKRGFSYRKEKTFSLEQYIYRPDFDDCSEAELRKLHSILKMRTKGFLRAQPAEIVIDGFPIQYFVSERNMKDCALFDAFDKVSQIVNDRFPLPAAKPEVKRPSNVHPSFLESNTSIDLIENVTSGTLDESKDSSSDSSSDDEMFLMDAKRTKLPPRPRFKVRGKNDIRKQTVPEAMNEFKKPAGNGKYDGAIPVCILKNLRENRSFDAETVSDKLISLFQTLENKQVSPTVKKQVIVPLNIKENLVRTNTGVINSLNMAKRTIVTGHSTYVPVSQLGQVLHTKPRKIILKSPTDIRRIHLTSPQIIRKGYQVKPGTSTNQFVAVSATPSSSLKYPILRKTILGPKANRLPVTNSNSLSTTVMNSNAPTTSNVQLPQRQLLPASSFNPPSTIAQKIQIIPGTDMNGPNGSKIHRIVTQVVTGSNANQPSWLKEAPQKTYSRPTPISLLASNQRVLPANVNEGGKGTVSVSGSSNKAAIVNLAKPMTLCNDPSSLKAASSVGTSGIAAVTNSSTSGMAAVTNSSTSSIAAVTRPSTSGLVAITQPSTSGNSLKKSYIQVSVSESGTGKTTAKIIPVDRPNLSLLANRTFSLTNGSNHHNVKQVVTMKTPSAKLLTTLQNITTGDSKTVTSVIPKPDSNPLPVKDAVSSTLSDAVSMGSLNGVPIEVSNFVPTEAASSITPEAPAEKATSMEITTGNGNDSTVNPGAFIPITVSNRITVSNGNNTSTTSPIVNVASSGLSSASSSLKSPIVSPQYVRSKFTPLSGRKFSIQPIPTVATSASRVGGRVITHPRIVQRNDISILENGKLSSTLTTAPLSLGTALKPPQKVFIKNQFVRILPKIPTKPPPKIIQRSEQNTNPQATPVNANQLIERMGLSNTYAVMPGGSSLLKSSLPNLLSPAKTVTILSQTNLRDKLQEQPQRNGFVVNPQPQ